MAVNTMEPEPALQGFAIPGILDFHQSPSGLTYMEVRTPAATATIYLQGAHLTAWQPTGERPVLFLSAKSDLAPEKPIRGGIPIAFPWFATDSKADRLDGKPGPSHGFARIQPWTLAFAALSGEDLHLTFILGPTDLSRSMGFDHFRVVYEVTIGRTLNLRLTVGNEGKSALIFEEALHTYFTVSDVHDVSVTGLEETPYIDKTDNFATKPAAHAPYIFTAFTDRIYNHTRATCVLHDPGFHRRIVIAKESSDTTVVFNPGKEMPDLGPTEWPHLLCIETVNASHSPITLAPGTTHTMQATFSVEKDA